MALSLAAHGSKFGQTGSGVFFLAKVANPTQVPFIPQVPCAPEPAFNGDVDAFIAKIGESDGLKRMLKNKVKKCTRCQKPNAFTLQTCNQCGLSLTDIPISYTNNVFTSFIFGIAKGPFPFTISLRYQAPDVMVFDDLLALSPCHVNVIPTQHYIPDWRYLLRRPAEGLQIIRRMYEACVEVAKSQFLANEKWRNYFIRDGVTAEDVLAGVAAGFNYPPSQYQLHTQFMLPNLIPFQFFQYRMGVHYTYKRFFPYSYVTTVLEKLVSSGTSLPATVLQDDTSIDEVINVLKSTIGVDYDDSHSQMYRSFETFETKVSNWKHSEFSGVVVDNSLYVSWDGTATTTVPTEISAITNDDKVALQSYGRPYTAEGKPTGSYYSMTKAPSDLTVW